MAMIRRMLAVAMTAAIAGTALAACGDKVPESEAAKKLGKVPKQTVDRAREGVNKALQQGVERTRDADKAN
jgi:hypothetical protein